MTIAEALAEFHEANPVAFLATRDGELPRVRPMSPVEIDGATVWMASGASSEKMAQIVGEPRAELCYMKPDHAHLRLRGAVEVCDDPDTKRRLWNAYPMLAGNGTFQGDCLLDDLIIDGHSLLPLIGIILVCQNERME